MRKIIYILLLTVACNFVFSACTEADVKPSNLDPTSTSGNGGGASDPQ